VREICVIIIFCYEPVSVNSLMLESKIEMNCTKINSQPPGKTLYLISKDIFVRA
jgi:hypothetical protein